ncbi:cupin domain-containing protein [Actinomycetospora chiangmaiensis]|uniref:cupin domain-containing protein n=1 Tax=Actinomycetospora chiangmaiensis TaxID=402650 RepID=UPI00037B1619|nr:cupin domain-containing protein [Actinomycetospora chiangmaiensis]
MGARPALAEEFDLAPHPEGGWFRRIWASPVVVTPPGYAGGRPSATAIHYVLAPGERSGWHRVRSDELWLWQRGGSLSVWVGEHPEGGVEHRLGPDDGPAALVPAGAWQRAEPTGHAAVLVTCVVSPGFDFADWELADEG